METCQKHPVFFSKSFFDFLKFDERQRAAVRPNIKYLNLRKTEVERQNTPFKIMRTGIYLDTFEYIQFFHADSVLLCVFGNNQRCCRAYYLNNILVN